MSAVSAVLCHPWLSNFLLEPLISVTLLYATEVVRLCAILYVFKLLSTDFEKTVFGYSNSGVGGSQLFIQFSYHPFGKLCFHNTVLQLLLLGIIFGLGIS